MNRPTSSSNPRTSHAKEEIIPICTALMGEPFPPTLTSSEDLSESQKLLREFDKLAGPGHPSLLGSTGATYVSPSFMWNNGATISYSFMDGTSEQTRKVENTIAEWTWYANVTFLQLPFGDSSAAVRITFAGGAAWSYIGNTARSKRSTVPTMALGWISDTTEFPDYERGTILHEFGHLLGLLHEHQGPAAARAFRWKEAEVLKWYRKHGYTDTFIRENVLFPYNETHVSCYSAFDKDSIMVYRINPEFNCEGLTANLNNNLSDMDKAYMVINYNRSTVHPKAPQWTLDHALHIAGVPEEIWRNWHKSNIREEFRRYQQSTRKHSLKIKYGAPVGKFQNGVLFYNIVCEANFPGFHPHSHVQRRYSHFERFRHRLLKINPSLNIPLLPPKGLFFNQYERQRDLLAWLELLADHQHLEKFQTLFQHFLQDERYEI
ncbi:hypothetical protein B0H16DRAFT_1899008 [Mycena metata]|uniref:PX domain-containing protein n=1 Tax=Mycena metata TaxID=1033252 RepID=A0AAD7H8Q9_9AGAR|nr:hypothetical protein B0H16DRAFT_1899008 [Mycena metata]